jgi:choline-sulfatase
MIGKVMLRESSVRIPMIISWPGKFPRGKSVDAPVSLVDLYPTLLELAGYRLPDILPLDGNSLLPLVRGRAGDSPQRVVFGEFEGEGWNHPRAFVRVGDYKYIHYHTSKPELYNVREDYYEMENLAGRRRYSRIESQLRKRVLQDWDPGRIEIEVLRTQARQKLACCRNVCGDLGW